MAAPSLVLSLLGLCVTVGHVACQICPKDWYDFKDSCYGIGIKPVSWGEAQAICKTSNGKLAEIETTEENAFIKSLLGEKQVEQIWIGGTDIFHEGNWVWSSTNQPIDKFVNWGPGEPNNYEGQECMRLDTYIDYKWDDLDCQDTLTFLCESLGLSE